MNYLHEIKTYSSHYIDSIIFQDHHIGEGKFKKCVKFDANNDWWVDTELQKLSINDQLELLTILKYKKYIDDVLDFNYIEFISDIMGCATFHLYRCGKCTIRDLSNFLKNASASIYTKSCAGDISEDTKQFKDRISKFKDIKSFIEFKTNP